MLVIMGANISKGKQKWKKKDQQQRAKHPFSYHGRCVNLSDIILILLLYYYIIIR